MEKAKTIDLSIDASLSHEDRVSVIFDQIADQGVPTDQAAHMAELIAGEVDKQTSFHDLQNELRKQLDTLTALNQRQIKYLWRTQISFGIIAVLAAEQVMYTILRLWH
jgi:hypothetical protein